MSSEIIGQSEKPSTDWNVLVTFPDLIEDSTHAPHAK